MERGQVVHTYPAFAAFNFSGRWNFSGLNSDFEFGVG